MSPFDPSDVICGRFFNYAEWVVPTVDSNDLILDSWRKWIGIKKKHSIMAIFHLVNPFLNSFLLVVRRLHPLR